ncbi:glucosaminidase domain-containing protein [Enterococcus sp. BWR-S5]|uniref:glucosaminidase domain-containing protein n=1 Tax=Enterococcus sp. BWR-S5 TaxID=2787714 RepID=UPI001F02616A|nr:glucosaminidase domain-containing protein [Enterococcus sp. BWR-S5]
MKKTLALLSVSVLLASSFPITTYAEMGNVPENPVTEETTTETEETGSSETTDSSTEESVSNPEPETPESSTESPEPVPTPTPPTTNETPTPAPTTPVEPDTGSNGYISEQPAAVVPQNENSVTIKVDPSSFHFEKSTTTEEFVEQIGEHAREIGQETDLFASVMIAQAILESGSGSSQLSQEPYYNLFGIKGEYEGQFVVFPTFEQTEQGESYQIESMFRQYPSYKESFQDYSELLTEGVSWNAEIYAGTWKSNASSYQEATEALTGTYATDIEYNQKLNGLIETYDLTRFDNKKEEAAPAATSVINTATHEDSDFEDYDGTEMGAYAYGNCTAYAYNRVFQLGKTIPATLGNGMDWTYNAVVSGLTVKNKPVSGSVVCFQPGVAGADSRYGHVAFVEHVYEDQSILISESNVIGLNQVSFRVIPASIARSIDYIVPL